jgi:hypothetical protein
MGDKSHLNYQSNRPESGGANKDERLEKSKIIEREVEDAQAHNAALRDDTPSSDDQADGDDDDRLNVIPDEQRRT